MSTQPGEPSGTSRRGSWWESAVIYEVYPRSFADGNGDGVGDLAGLAARLSYRFDKGVDGLRKLLARGDRQLADLRAQPGVLRGRGNGGGASGAAARNRSGQRGPAPDGRVARGRQRCLGHAHLIGWCWRPSQWSTGQVTCHVRVRSNRPPAARGAGDYCALDSKRLIQRSPNSGAGPSYPLALRAL